ncbi:MAG: hypothetical protein R3B93_24400 [Bacteroidia bacterium]
MLHNAYRRWSNPNFFAQLTPLPPGRYDHRPDGTSISQTCITASFRKVNGPEKAVPSSVKIQQYQLDKVVRLGRIWRLTHQDFERIRPNPRMCKKSPQKNYWHISATPTAGGETWHNRVLVQRRDQSVAPELETIVRTSDHLLARFHAFGC